MRSADPAADGHRGNEDRTGKQEEEGFRSQADAETLKASVDEVERLLSLGLGSCVFLAGK